MILNKIISDRIEQLPIPNTNQFKINLFYGIYKFWNNCLSDKERLRVGKKIFIEHVLFDDKNLQIFCEKLNIKPDAFSINVKARLYKILANSEWSNLFGDIFQKSSEHSNKHVIEEFEKSPEHAEYCCLCPTEFHRQFFAELKSYRDLLSQNRLDISKRIVEEYPNTDNLANNLKEFFEDYKKSHFETASHYLKYDYSHAAIRILNRNVIKY